MSAAATQRYRPRRISSLGRTVAGGTSLRPAVIKTATLMNGGTEADYLSRTLGEGRY